MVVFNCEYVNCNKRLCAQEKQVLWKYNTLFYNTLLSVKEIDELSFKTYERDLFNVYKNVLHLGREWGDKRVFRKLDDIDMNFLCQCRELFARSVIR